MEAVVTIQVVCTATSTAAMKLASRLNQTEESAHGGTYDYQDVCTYPLHVASKAKVPHLHSLPALATHLLCHDLDSLVHIAYNCHALITWLRPVAPRQL